MKLSIVVSLQPTKFSALAFQEHLEESLKMISSLGYDGVELAVRNPAEIDIAQVEKLLEKFHLGVSGIGTGQAYIEEGLSFSHPDKDIRQKAIERIKTHLEFGAKIHRTAVIIGLLRGKTPPGQKKEQAISWFRESLLKCAETAARQGVNLLLEPLNRYETDLLNTLPETKEFIKANNLPNVFLLADTFHMNIEEVSFAQSLSVVKDYLKHVHLADSNRWAPGCGHLDFKEIVRVLKNIGYENYVAAEILPLPTPEESARLTIQYLKKIM